ncbi:flagellar filament capping protein FliD [Nitrospina gracilis]|uniref:flagellar filament capping protein FliD n=1 Tax=Nitrospina gracilis TaxID=35801 RepID=UPI001F0249FB|nr:flagellar filament capping protein FliD [Nitrospina gracilis]MCF8719769.1 flagellar capping protein FliD [Nitrospina gracilis Nb-211]
MALAGLSSSLVNTFNLSLTGKLNLNARLPQEESTPPATPFPNRANILTDSFTFVNRGFPVIDDLRGPLDALRVASTGRFLTENFQNTGLPALDDFNKKERVVQLQNDALRDLRTRLQTLRESVQTLREKGALNLFSGFSADPDVVEVAAGGEASASRFSISVLQTATRDKLVSNVQATGALGLSGSFSVNGVEVTVEAGDSLLDIALKINRGEDTNGNGVLDGPEDFNGNGSIDIIEIEPSEFFEGLFVIEDANNNGVLDPTEDANGNGRLDGGTAETGVTAAVSSDNRLVLLAEEGGRINLDDPDGILLQLGFFALTPEGASVQKDTQLVTINERLVDLNSIAGRAKIQVDGKTFSSDTNIFTNVAEGVTLTLNGTSTDAVRVRVFLDAASAAGQIETFVDRFNDALTAFNKILGDDRLFARDLDIQTLRSDLVQGSQDTLRGVNEQDAVTQSRSPGQQDIRSLGIDAVNAEKASFQEVGLGTAVRSLRDNIRDLFQHVGSKLFRELSAIGIRTQSDDTLQVDRAQLERALTRNPEKVFDILTNADNGILTRLDPILEQALDESLGILDFKEEQIQQLAQVPSKIAELFQDNARNDLLRNLIAVV